MNICVISLLIKWKPVILTESQLVTLKEEVNVFEGKTAHV